MTVEDILRNKGREVVTIAANATLEQAARRLIERRIGALVVTAAASQRMAGLITERDIVRLAAEHGGAALPRLTVGAMMVRRVLVCKPSDPVDALMGLITRERVRHLPVFDNDVLVGIVSIGDIVKYRLDEQAVEIGLWRELFAPPYGIQGEAGAPP